MDNEQHFLTQLVPYEKLLDTIPLVNRNVVEFGCGHGEITRLLLDRGANVLCYEIDPGLTKTLRHPNLSIIIDDVLDQDLEEVNDMADPAFIANPPYDLVPFLRIFLDTFIINDFIIMIPPKYLQLFPEATIEIEYDGLAFYPPSKGSHLVIKAGF